MSDWSDVPVPKDQSNNGDGVLHPEVVGQDNYGTNMVFGFDTGAVLALALAIASWLVLPVIGAIAALWIAPSATRRIRQADGALGTTSIVRAAQIIAIANLVVFVLIVLLLIAVIRAVF